MGPPPVSGVQKARYTICDHQPQADSAICVRVDGVVRGGRVPRADCDDAGVRVEPFTLGVASGDPLPDGVVIWTRLAPSPLTMTAA